MFCFSPSHLHHFFLKDRNEKLGNTVERLKKEVVGASKREDTLRQELAQQALDWEKRLADRAK